MSEADTSCPSTGIFCKYLETTALIQESAVIMDATTKEYKTELLASSLGYMAAKMKPSLDQECREGYCAVVDNMLREVIIASAAQRSNDTILGIGQPLLRRKKTKSKEQ